MLIILITIRTFINSPARLCGQSVFTACICLARPEFH